MTQVGKGAGKRPWADRGCSTRYEKEVFTLKWNLFQDLGKLAWKLVSYANSMLKLSHTKREKKGAICCFLS